MKFFILDISYSPKSGLNLYGIRGKQLSVTLPKEFYSIKGYRLANGNEENVVPLFSLKQGTIMNFIPTGRGNTYTLHQCFESIEEKLAVTKGIVPLVHYGEEEESEERKEPKIVFFLVRNGEFSTLVKNERHVYKDSSVEAFYSTICLLDPDILITFRLDSNAEVDLKCLQRFPDQNVLGRVFIDLFKVIDKFGSSKVTMTAQINTMDELIKYEKEFNLYETIKVRCEMFRVSPKDIQVMFISSQYKRFMKYWFYSQDVAWPPLTTPAPPSVSRKLESGFILDPIQIGTYNKCPIFIFDVKSMYPSIICHYNLCFSTLRFDENKQPYFIKETRGFLPRLAKLLVEERKRMVCPIQKTQMKFLANMLYGTIATENGEFYSFEIAKEIVTIGRRLIQDVIATIIAAGGKPLYAHTDSVFFYIPFLSDPIKGREIAEKILEERINNGPILKDKPSIRMALQTVTRKMVILRLNQYVMLNEEGTDIVFVGKPNMFPFANKVIHEFFHRFMVQNQSEVELNRFLDEKYDQLLRGEVDVLDLAYRQTTHKDVTEDSRPLNDLLKAAILMRIREKRRILAGELVTFYYYKGSVEPTPNPKLTLDYPFYYEKLSNFFSYVMRNVLQHSHLDSFRVNSHHAPRTFSHKPKKRYKDITEYLKD